MFINYFDFFILSFLYFSCTSSVFGEPLLRTECVTRNEQNRFAIGRKQTYPGTCGMHKCSRFKLFDDIDINYAVAVPYKCRLDYRKKPGCNEVRSQNDKLNFPDCCPIYGCMKGKNYTIIRTSPDGYLERYRINSAYAPKPVNTQILLKFNPFYGKRYNKTIVPTLKRTIINYDKLQRYGTAEEVIVDLEEDIQMVDVESAESSKDIRANLDNKVNEINPVCQCKKCINIEAPDDSTKRPCSSRVYCYGPLLHEVQMTQPHLYSDSKSFVDMRMRNSEIETLRNFNKLMNETNCEPSRNQLSEFVNKTFEEGKELDKITPEDFNKSPSFLNNIKDPELKKFASFLNEMWPELARKVPIEAKTKSKQYSILPVPYTFVVPGGRFREPYYWDSYWIISGLLICEMKDTARDMLKNFFWFVDKYGFVLNGGRIYYEKRSQPPLLAHMVYLYVKKTNDKKFLEEKVGENTNIQLLEKELVFWSKNSKVSVKGNTLLRYYVDVEGPRPEGYREDYIMTDNDTDSLKYLYKEFKSAAESGWDYSSRWFANPDTDRSLKNLKVTNIAPVDLNAFYCGGLNHLTELYSLLGNTAKSEEWKKKGDEFRESIYKVLWSETDGIWFDVDITTGEHRKQFYPSNMSPLWTKVIHASQSSADVANRVAQYLNGTKEFHLPGGVPASNINTSQQWDYPNVWPPLLGYMVEGLQNSDSNYAKELAFELTERWIYSNYLSYDSGKRMYEKYHCEFPGQRGAGGEYTVQFGFGWTNGVILEMLNVYGDRLSLTAIKERVEQLMQSKT